MISIKISDEALKDLFLLEGNRIRPATVIKGVPSNATLISSEVVGPGTMEMIWDLHDGVKTISTAQIIIESNTAQCQALYDANLMGGYIP